MFFKNHKIVQQNIDEKLSAHPEESLAPNLKDPHSVLKNIDAIETIRIIEESMDDDARTIGSISIVSMKENLENVITILTCIKNANLAINTLK